MLKPAEDNATGRLWTLVMAILAGLATVALFLTGLGYHSVERRLCMIEGKLDPVFDRLVKVETHQQYRLERERLQRERLDKQ